MLQTVRLDGDPDDIAAQLLKPEQPGRFLDDIRIDTDEGLAELLVHLTSRMGRASIEKDELLRFAQRNRNALTSEKMEVLRQFVEAAQASDEKFGMYFTYFTDNLKLAIEGRTAEMNMRSDKLFWLVYALTQQISAGYITYDKARAKLARPEVVARISQHQLIYMIQDYAEGLETAHEPPKTMLLMIGECALLAHLSKVLDVVCSLIVRDPPKQRTETLDFLRRGVAYLASRGENASEIQAGLNRLSARAARVSDADL